MTTARPPVARVPATPLAEQRGPYFHPLPARPIEAELRERAAKFRAIEEMQLRAWALSDPWTEHPRENYLAAEPLWLEIAVAYDSLGNREAEAAGARHQARRCREKAGA